MLGSGSRPINRRNIKEFPGVPDIEYDVIVNVDIRKYPTTDFVQDLSEKNWKIADSQYDVVIAEHVAEHVPDRLSFISECRRITKDGGILIIEVPNWKHENAHNTLEHYTTWGRCIFNDSYINDNGKMWKVEKVVYRMTYFWKSFYLPFEFFGRQIDKYTSQISGLRFYIRIKK
jgi:SAM-dependent methyltransferase